MKVVIVGTGSMAQEAVSILRTDRNFEICGYTDSDPEKKGRKFLDIEVIGTNDVWPSLYKQGIHGAVVAVGFDNNLREKYFHQLKDIGFEMINVIHPSAIIDPYASISEGVFIGPGCTISLRTKIEHNTIIEAGTVIGANTQIADNVYIGIGCNIDGGGYIKRNAHLEPGCSVAAFVNIGKNVFVQPGTAVTENLEDEVRNEA